MCPRRGVLALLRMKSPSSSPGVSASPIIKCPLAIRIEKAHNDINNVNLTNVGVCDIVTDTWNFCVAHGNTLCHSGFSMSTKTRSNPSQVYQSPPTSVLCNGVMLHFKYKLKWGEDKELQHHTCLYSASFVSLVFLLFYFAYCSSFNKILSFPLLLCFRFLKSSLTFFCLTSCWMDRTVYSLCVFG
ncbi:UNVERIFIED_CONTAM: hypothetical protein K2H54_066749 [Gekko kuhli]